MLQFLVTEGPGAVRSVTCTDLPFTIGRVPGANLQLTAPGVWDAHACVTRDVASGKLAIEPVGEALLLVNGQRSDRKVLDPGDEIQLGAVHLVVGLAAVAQKGLAATQGLAWLLLSLVVALQIALLLALR